MKSLGVVLFYSTNAAFLLEKTLKKSGILVKLIPTPRNLSSDCGTALRFPWEHAELVKTVVETTQIEIAGIHQLPASI